METKEIIADLRRQMRTTKFKMHQIVSALDIDTEEMTVYSFMAMLESLQYRPDVLRSILKEDHSYSKAR